MSSTPAINEADRLEIGDEIYELASEIYPICRSITGNGVRETLQRLTQKISLDIHEIPSGTGVLDWIVPDEWNIRDAYIKNSRGEQIVDFRTTNLHVMSYSTPVHEQISLDELRKHIFTLPDQPSLIPYRTSYYVRASAFCMSHDQFCELQNDTYEVMIDSDLKPGNLTIGEAVHKGESDEEVLLSAHVCHPSLANDNCSGIALLACLANLICREKDSLHLSVLVCAGDYRGDCMA